MFLRAYGAVFSAEKTFRIPGRLAIGEGRVKKATLTTLVGNIALRIQSVEMRQMRWQRLAESVFPQADTDLM